MIWKKCLYACTSDRLHTQTNTHGSESYHIYLGFLRHFTDASTIYIIVFQLRLMVTL